MQAVVELGTEHGFASLTLADIVGRAGVARSTFYEHFTDKQDCFLAAFDYAADPTLSPITQLRGLAIAVRLTRGMPPRRERTPRSGPSR